MSDFLKFEEHGAIPRIPPKGFVGIGYHDNRWIYNLQKFIDTLTMPIWEFIWRKK
jgi:hypothetical protein